MRIISPFKDYYDHMAHVYGADGRVTYVRNLLKGDSSEHPDEYVPFEDTHDIPLPGSYEYKEGKFDVRCEPQLIVAGCHFFYIMEEVTSEGAYTNKVVHSCKWKPYRPSPQARKSRWLRNEESLPSTAWNYKAEILTAQIGVPVFRVIHGLGHPRKLCVCVRIPRLQDYGIDKLIPAESIYQDIEYTLTNVLHKDAVPEPQSQKDKVLAHGFDLKTSFRGKV